ncbi:MAG: peptidylprolyl isomerase [Planctomycetota bacterium]|nr:MAG: peptidylprolyl isomerase [Planctomycetota bacterium]
MTKAEKGNTVRVHYTGKLDDGTVFDTSKDQDPLEFKVGEGQVIPGFESSVEGMTAGETKTVTIPCESAYGPRREELVAEVSRGELPENMELELGQQLQIPEENGHLIVLTIVGLTDETVTLDSNHPLAGKELTFDIELVEICE